MPKLDFTTNPHDQIDRERSAYMDATHKGGDSVTKFRDYYAGNQPNTLTKEQKAILEGLGVNNSSDNVCAEIVDEGAARLVLTLPEVKTGEESSDESVEAVKVWIEQELWIKNHAPKVANETHRAAIRDRDYCLLPFWKPPTAPNDKGRVILYEEPYWDTESGVYIHYDERHQPLYAVKEWSETDEKGLKFTRRDIWVEDAIYRYKGLGAGSWEKFARPDDPIVEGVEIWPVPWTDPATGEPLGIPYAHFQCDKSALSGGVLGNQDILNDMGKSIVACLRMTAYQMYWATGSDGPETGTVETVGPGVFKHLPSPDSNTGVYPAGDIQPMLDARESHLQRMASVAAMPTHIFSGTAPSGEALYRSELPSVNMARARAERFKPAWASLFHTAIKLANAFGKAGLDANALIVCQYEDVDQFDDLKRFLSISALFDAAQKAVNAGVPLETFMSKYSDWTPADIEKLEADMEAERQRVQEEEARSVDLLTEQAERVNRSRNGSRERVAA